MADDIKELFPEINEVGSDEIRDVIVSSWDIVREESDTDDITEVHWAPHYASDVGEQNLVRHVREVTDVGMDVADRLSSQRDVEMNRDHVIAGGLLHDISKPFEHEGNFHTELRDFLEHPHFSVYVLEKAGAPLNVQHIALSHTPRASVNPRTIEAAIIMYSDILAMDSIFWEATSELKSAFD